jgi:hypothetical protein
LPIRYRFFPTAELIVSRHIGLVSDEELLARYRRMYEDRRFRPQFAKLVDLRQSEASGRSAEGLSALARLARSHYPEGGAPARTAILARDDLSFGLGRMYEGLTSRSAEEVMVFREFEAACAWLGVAPELLEGPDDDGEGQDEA